MSVVHCIRRATAADATALGALYRDTITSVNSRDYSAEQVAVWAGRSQRTESLLQRIESQYFLVAEEDGQPTGFGSITAGGFLDMLFVHKDHQGKGIANALVDMLESYAVRHDALLLTAEVSITARPFFEKKGFEIVQEQQVAIDGVPLTNFKMRKFLS
ncbi:GNAT family N-acetyltransferase [Flaviaesturariibacter aridisoli]|uniref:GNAT family N-acetyltransferase n=1 Tax=Flaviaesturariibacter aridisoli TaxID=2545761 RepID=A0A4R4E4C7_9BACT|nr:GNAT family N-acetyltransferase [Flaviaesturariibacter aridisoli]TCZ74444.1 GNAT family N-acetyltransferase [Flaviaesturariibacter aridisoli]